MSNLLSWFFPKYISVKSHATFATLPEFPEFKKLELSDKADIEKITSKYPPYSDFNFVSMWSWDIKGDMRICALNGNLVVRFTDYVTGIPFYSFLGDNEVNDTAEELIELSKKEGLKPELKLIPEIVATRLDPRFKVAEDRDNFDYIYEIPILAELSGNAFQTQRNLINQFTRLYKNLAIKVVNLSEIYHKNNIMLLFNQWIENKDSCFLVEGCENEFLALKRLLLIDDYPKFNLTCFEISVKEKLVGFIINEKVGEYDIVHFEKADISFKGSYQLLMQKNSKILNQLNIKFLNFEQDLGSSALRFTKMKFRPVFFLKKYLITT